MPDLPGKVFFRCDKHRASLSLDSCKTMYQAGRKATEVDDRLHPCNRCVIGAAHCGVSIGASKNTAASKACSRCHRTPPRLLNGSICVSCYNRELELAHGHNSRGKLPGKIRPLHPVILHLLDLDGEPKTIEFTVPRAVDTMEAILTAIKRQPGAVFGWLGHKPTPYQARQLQLDYGQPSNSLANIARKLQIRRNSRKSQIARTQLELGL